MPELLTNMLAYPFIVRAFTAGIFIVLCAALLGVSLVLKRYSMIGDGLSHVGFGALTVAAAMNLAPLSVAIPAVVLTAFLLLRLGESGKIKGDAATALISAGSLAAGVMILSFSKKINNLDMMGYMFGSILTTNRGDVNLSVILCGFVLFLYIIFYSKIFAVTFDESFARATGTNAGFYNALLAVLTALTVVLGMRLMGALLISALIIFPPVTAMKLFKSFRGVVAGSALLGAVCFVLGIVISFVWETPAGASVVSVNAAAFALVSGVKWLRGLRK